MLGGVAGPLVGIAAGIGSLITITDLVRIQAGQKTGKLDNESLSLVSSNSNGATYAGSVIFHTPADLGAGTNNTAVVIKACPGAFGDVDVSLCLQCTFEHSSRYGFIINNKNFHSDVF